MAESSVEEPAFVEEIFPDDDPEDESALLGSDGLEEEDDLEFTVEPEPEPIGRSAAFDFDAGRFLTSGHEPRPTRQLDTVRGWIEKCLRTHAGAHPVHPDGYGLDEPIDSYLNGDDDVSIGEMEVAIIDALQFHPAITRIENMQAEDGETEDGDLAVHISFGVILDDDSDFDFTTTLRSGGTDA